MTKHTFQLEDGTLVQISAKDSTVETSSDGGATWSRIYSPEPPAEEPRARGRGHASESKKEE